MPQRTTVVFPPRLKQRAMARARKRKISFSEFVRRAVEDAVIKPQLKNAGQLSNKLAADPYWSDVAVYEGPVPPDISSNHDKYLYDEPEP